MSKFAFESTKPGFDTRAPAGCHGCGRLGHKVRECPSIVQQEVRCLNCGGIGHSDSSCHVNLYGGASGSGQGDQRPRQYEDRRAGGGGGQSYYNRGGSSSSRHGGGGASSSSSTGGGGHRYRYGDRNGDAHPRRAGHVPEQVNDMELYHRSIAPGPDMADILQEEIVQNASANQNVIGSKTKKIKKWDQMNLHPNLMRNLELSGYKRPTPVQSVVVPMVINGKDVMATAATGSGKTLAYVLPIVNRMVISGEASMPELEPGLAQAQTSRCALPLCLILLPTRELAIQTHEQVLKCIRGLPLRSILMYGGTDVHHTYQSACTNPTFVVATIGRLQQMRSEGFIRYDRLKYLVLDEADRMLEVESEVDIRAIARDSTMPPKENRQTIMMSATFPDEVQKIAEDFLREGEDDWEFVRVGVLGKPPKSIRQTIVLVRADDKREELVQWCRDEMLEAEKTKEIRKSASGETECFYSRKSLIFVERKRNVDFYTSYLITQQIPAISIHGDRTQEQRELALRRFREGRDLFLVATGVAERGLDIPGVDNVLNVDLPHTAEEYVHRIGRTGRLGNRGSAYSFFDPHIDNDVAPSLVKTLRDCRQQVPSFLARFEDPNTSIADLSLSSSASSQATARSG